MFQGFCQAFATLESLDDKIKKKAILEGIVERFPAVPAAWLELAKLTDDDDARLRAITRGLEHDPDAGTNGMLLINRALILHRRGDKNEAIAILGQLALDPASTLDVEAWAKAMLARFVH